MLSSCLCLGTLQADIEYFTVWQQSLIIFQLTNCICTPTILTANRQQAAVKLSNPNSQLVFVTEYWHWNINFVTDNTEMFWPKFFLRLAIWSCHRPQTKFLSKFQGKNKCLLSFKNSCKLYLRPESLRRAKFRPCFFHVTHRINYNNSDKYHAVIVTKSLQKFIRFTGIM